VVPNGDDIDELFRPASSWYLFDNKILYPRISPLPAHLPYTLAQRGVLRLDDAIQAVDDLIQVLDDRRFRNSPFAEYRDVKKAAAVREALTVLRFAMVETARNLNFEGVFLERQELINKRSKRTKPGVRRSSPGSFLSRRSADSKNPAKKFNEGAPQGAGRIRRFENFAGGAEATARRCSGVQLPEPRAPLG
jgi:hypothetical protein